MPKKPARNAFYLYMVDFKEEQRRKGVNYSLKEAADAAGPLWKEISPSVRAKYEAKAKAEKQKYNVPEQKYTSTGLSFAEIDQQERELKEAESNERQDIKNMVKLKNFNNTLLDEDFYLMDVNAYCKIRDDYFIGESTMLRFNLNEGIKDYYTELMNPGKIPPGYASSVKQGCQEFGLKMPDEEETQSNYMQILANLIDYLKQQDRDAKALPPIFTMPDKVAVVQNFITQMCHYAGERESLFRVYKLDFLFFTMINTIKTKENEGFPKESLSLAQLKKDSFKYTPGLGCQHHEELDKSVECTTSRARRWAYTILDSCCPLTAIEVVPGKHVPRDYDVDSIVLYKEQKKASVAPTFDGVLSAGPSANVSVLSYSSVASSTAREGDKPVKRKHVPLRMPKTDLMQMIGNVPDVTENEGFLAVTRGGRGRGLPGSFNNLNINN